MANKTILIIDDEADLLEALDTALTDAGFETLTASHGAAGLELAFAHKPNLILLDIIMPQMSGHEVLAKLRRDPWGKEVPVLFLTNSDDPKNITAGFENEGSGYLIKSNTSLDTIVKKVKQYLGGYHD